MGLCGMGLFINDVALLTPAILLMLGHGIVSAGLFFCVGSLYERTHTRDLNLLASGAAVMPKLSFYFLLFILGNIAFPGTVNFIAEFAILKGLLHYDPLVVLLIMPSYFANSAFNIWLATRVLYGTANRLKTIIHPEDFTFRELIIVRNLCLIMIGLGTIFADPIISQIERGLTLQIPFIDDNETNKAILNLIPAEYCNRHISDDMDMDTLYNLVPYDLSKYPNYFSSITPIQNYMGIIDLYVLDYDYVCNTLGIKQMTTLDTSHVSIRSTYFDVRDAYYVSNHSFFPNFNELISAAQPTLHHQRNEGIWCHFTTNLYKVIQYILDKTK